MAPTPVETTIPASLTDLMSLSTGLEGTEGTVSPNEQKFLAMAGRILETATPEDREQMAVYLRKIGVLNGQLQTAHQRLALLEELGDASETTIRTKEDLIAFIQNLLREKYRNVRFRELKERGNDSAKKALEKVDDFNRLKASDVLLLAKNADFDPIKFFLVDAQDATREVSRDTLKAGDKLTVNMGTNREFHNKLGAGDILKLKSSMVVTKAIIRNEKGEVIEGGALVYGTNPRPGYYRPDENGQPIPNHYGEIYDGYNIEVVEIRERTATEIEADSASRNAYYRKMRMADVLDAKDKNDVLTSEDDADLASDEAIEKARTERREQIGKGKKYADDYGRARSVSGEKEKVKLGELTFDEAKLLFVDIFGTGAATDLWIRMAQGQACMLTRMVALGAHESDLEFHAEGEDPCGKGSDKGAFQIYAEGRQANANARYAKLLADAGRRYGVSSFASLTPAQQDLLVHAEYIRAERGGEATFAGLRDGNMPEGALITFMHKKVQGGIEAIGIGVVAQLQNVNITVPKRTAAMV